MTDADFRPRWEFKEEDFLNKHLDTSAAAAARANEIINAWFVCAGIRPVEREEDKYQKPMTMEELGHAVAALAKEFYEKPRTMPLPPCEHELISFQEYYAKKYGYSIGDIGPKSGGWITSTMTELAESFLSWTGETKCKHCGVKLKANWEVAE